MLSPVMFFKPRKLSDLSLDDILDDILRIRNENLVSFLSPVIPVMTGVTDDRFSDQILLNMSPVMTGMTGDRYDILRTRNGLRLID